MDVINLFGKHIKHVGLVGMEHLNAQDQSVIYQSLNDHCSDILISLGLRTINEHTFAYFSKPFEKVTALGLRIKRDDVVSNMQFGEMFPNLKSLDMAYADAANNVQNDRFIDCELPVMTHLKTVSIRVDVTTNRSDIDAIHKQLSNMFEKNQQIDSLKYIGNLNDFIQDINEFLPNLDYFAIDLLDSEIRPVHFDQVKHFTVSTGRGPGPFDRISFTRLDSMKLSYWGNDSIHSDGTELDTWKAFFGSSQNIGKFDINAIADDEEIVNLLSACNAEEIRITSYHYFSFTFLGQLIETRKNWWKLHYDANHRQEETYSEITGFVEKFQNEWNITYSFEDRPFIDLKRKN